MQFVTLSSNVFIKHGANRGRFVFERLLAERLQHYSACGIAKQNCRLNSFRIGFKLGLCQDKWRMWVTIDVKLSNHIIVF